MTMSPSDSAIPPAARCPLPTAPRSPLDGLPLEAFHFHIAGRAWSIRAVRDQDALLEASERFAEFPFGLLLWDSAPVLAKALAARTDLIAGRRVLELGAGVGLVGLVARWLGGEVRQTDHVPEALELSRMNAAANGIDGIDVALADWSAWRDEARYDLIVGSDVLYDKAVHAPVMGILERNLAPGGRVLLSDPGRMDTPAFLERLERAGWRVECDLRLVILPASFHHREDQKAAAITLIAARRSS